MAKRKTAGTSANDYLEQLQWRSRHRILWPIQLEPKWKYKIVYRYPRSAWLDRILALVVLIGFVIAIALLLSSKSLLPGAKVFFAIVFALIIVIVFFAVRDATKDEDDSSRHLE